MIIRKLRYLWYLKLAPHYKVLFGENHESDYDLDTIKERYRALAKIAHQDKPSEEARKNVETLKDIPNINELIANGYVKIKEAYEELRNYKTAHPTIEKLRDRTTTPSRKTSSTPEMTPQNNTTSNKVSEDRLLPESQSEREQRVLKQLKYLVYQNFLKNEYNQMHGTLSALSVAIGYGIKIPTGMALISFRIAGNILNLPGVRKVSLESILENIGDDVESGQRLAYKMYSVTDRLFCCSRRQRIRERDESSMESKNTHSL